MKNILYKIPYLTFLILFISVKTYSQFGWYPQNSGTTQNLNFIYYNQFNSKIYIVGDSGVILVSEYPGLNWTRVPSGTSKNLNSISYSNSDYFITADNGLILKSPNGIVWSVLNSETTNNLNSIYCAGVYGIMAGDSGTILRSSNLGNNWSLLTPVTDKKLNCVSYSSYITGNDGTILKSINYGLNWFPVNSNTLNNLNFTNYSFIVGNVGTILKSSDNGYNWLNINSGTIENLNSVSSYTNCVWAAGENGTIIRSNDAGNSWSSQHINTSEHLNSIIFPFYSFNTGFLVGNNGIIMKTTTNTTNIYSRNIDANQINALFRNDGSFNNNSSFEWPAGSGLKARYYAGIWMGCTTGNDTLTSMIKYGAGDFVSGYIDNSGNSQSYNDTNYRIYKIVKGDSLSPDYLNWPAYQGAYLNSEGKPYFLGTQTMFYVYNDNYFRQSGYTSIAPMKAQILQTNWAYNRPGLLGNVIFTEYRIINRGSRIWNNFYFGIWNDDDVNCPCYGKTGCDTIRNLGYNYFTNTNDPQYGSNPPAIGNLFLNGLLKYTGNANDTVRYYNPPGSNNLIVKAGYVNLKLRVSNRFNNSSYPPEPTYNTETYRVITGHRRNGESWINPVTNNVTTFVHPGDPVTNTGWIQEYTAYKRTFHGTGPATVNPGDTVTVLYAQLIARGSDNINSITKLRETADFVQQIYDENFQSVVSIKNISTEVPVNYELYQNYPNPFNPVTHLKFGISKLGFISLKVYDMLGKEVKILVNEDMSAGRYVVEFDGSNLPSGIYFYKFTADEFSETKSMVLLK